VLNMFTATRAEFFQLQRTRCPFFRYNLRIIPFLALCAG